MAILSYASQLSSVATSTSSSTSSLLLPFSLPSQPPSSFSSQTLWLSLSRTSYINLYLCIITVILRIQSWLSKSQRNTIPVPEKTIFLRLEICNQSISMKSPAKRKWNEEQTKGKMILLAMLLCLKTFPIFKMFEGGIWSEKLLINRDLFLGLKNRDIRKLNLRLILNSEERRNTLHWFRKYYIDFLTFQIAFLNHL